MWFMKIAGNRMPGSPTSPMGVQLRSRRDAGLAVTLNYAQQHSPFYAAELGVREITPDNVRDILISLPPMPHDRWQANRDQIQTAPTGDAIIGYTGGSTSAHKVYLSTQAERQALAELLRNAPGPSTRTLRLATIRHGIASHEDFGPNTLTVPFGRLEVDFEAVAKILERSAPPYLGMPPFGAISGTLHMIKVLTRFLLETDRRPADFGISQIVVFSQMLSPRWRTRLEDWWGSKVDEIYGFSELRMCNSRKCRYCNLFHLPPTCFGEVLDPDGHLPIGAGSRVGTLSVTAFYPFVQLEPRIRYCPGDIVEVADRACPFWGEPGFRVLGRERHSVRLGQEWVCSAHCFSAVADLPDVATFDEIALSLGDPSYHECGSPQFQLERTETGATLFVELRHDPALWPSESRAVQDAIAVNLPVPGLNIVTCAPGKLPSARYFV
jgi:hypothetical protein